MTWLNKFFKAHNLLIRGASAAFIFAIAALFILLAAYRLDQLSSLNYAQQVRSNTELKLGALRERIEGVIHPLSLVLREVTIVISENPDITQDEFTTKAHRLTGLDDSIINIAAARDLVVSMVYPLEGNESVLGFDYRSSAGQLPSIQKMIRTEAETVSGPVNLVQGGLGVIFRSPIYTFDGDLTGATRHLWGVVSIVVDYQKFIDKVGISDFARSYDLLIDVTGPTGKHENVFFGEETLEGNDPATLNVNFLFGEWNLHATPKGGWPTSSPTQLRERIAMAVVAMGLLLLMGYIMWLSESRKRAKRLLLNGIEALSDGFAMFDADDRLIISNSRYREIYDLPDDLVKPGTPFMDMLKSGATRGWHLGESRMEKDWITNFISFRRSTDSFTQEQHLANGLIIKASDNKMKDGSIVGLRVDVTELNRAKEAAEQANLAKTDFISVLSHELRTPLTVILGVAGLAANARLLNTSKTLMTALETGDRSPGDIQILLDETFAQISSLMGRMIQSGNHLLHLINEMLDFSKIESGTLSVSIATYDIKDIVDPVAQQLSTLSNKKGLMFEVTQDLGKVYADKVRVQQILYNLVGNAIKFTDTGSVRLIVKVKDDAVVFEVHDSGAGIPEDKLDSIFEAFYQIDSTGTRRADGTGMGLAIARSLANLQNGSLTVSSTLGEGSCFVLSLPSAKTSHDVEPETKQVRHA